MNDNKDAFDLWWEWPEKPLDSPLTIDAAIHDAVMALPPDERRDRAKVNEAVRDGLRLSSIVAEFRAGKSTVRSAYSRDGDNCAMQLRRRVQTH
jgi:hypothetical protein